MGIKFENLIQAIIQLNQRLANLEQILLEKSSENRFDEICEWLLKHDMQLKKMYSELEYLLGKKEAQKMWENRELIGFIYIPDHVDPLFLFMLTHPKIF
jgi:hypothetical protein